MIPGTFNVNTFCHSWSPSVWNYGVTYHDGSDSSPPRMIGRWKDVISKADTQNSHGTDGFATLIYPQWKFIHRQDCVFIFKTYPRIYHKNDLMYQLFFYKGYSETESTQIAKFTGPTWGQPGSCWPPDGPHVGPMKLAFRAVNCMYLYTSYRADKCMNGVECSWSVFDKNLAWYQNDVNVCK